MPRSRTHRLFRSRAARFEAVVRPHLDRLYRFALRMTQNPERAEDLLQSLLLKLYPRTDELEALDKAGPWLARALHNLYVDELRAARRTPLDQSDADDELLDGWPAAAATMPDVATEALFDTRRLEGALAQLSPEHRAVVAWHDIEGYTLEELARDHSIAVGTLKSRLHRARAHLRKLLTEPDVSAERVGTER